MIEIWKDIPGYEGIYQVSNCGNKKTLEKTVKSGIGFRIIKEKILSKKIDSGGYDIFLLSRYNKRIQIRTHVLVAKLFIPNRMALLLKVCRNNIQEGN
jgi:hypothetical protein